MSPFMRRLFTTVGMLVAVGGMRFLLPLIIVKFVGHTTISNAWNLALHDQAQFAQILASSHSIVAGFGGAFLMLTALEFFCDAEKDNHWILPCERWFKVCIWNSWYFVTMLVVFVLGMYAGDNRFVPAGLAGVVVFTVVGVIKFLLERLDNKLVSAGSTLVAGGIGTLIYLEVLDASFSFDGVIAAFAISNDIFVVAVGLGIGALFIRSMTIQLVEAGTLAEYQYLENGAGMFVHVPDWVVAGTSIGFIVVSALHSIVEKNNVISSTKEVFDRSIS
jgi:hypothetical protein